MSSSSNPFEKVDISRCGDSLEAIYRNALTVIFGEIEAEESSWKVFFLSAILKMKANEGVLNEIVYESLKGRDPMGMLSELANSFKDSTVNKILSPKDLKNVLLSDLGNKTNIFSLLITNQNMKYMPFYVKILLMEYSLLEAIKILGEAFKPIKNIENHKFLRSDCWVQENIETAKKIIKETDCRKTLLDLRNKMKWYSTSVPVVLIDAVNTRLKEVEKITQIEKEYNQEYNRLWLWAKPNPDDEVDSKPHLAIDLQSWYP